MLIVAANTWAYHDYWTYAAYICRAGRHFRPDIDRLGYYADGAIQREFPKILGRRDHVRCNVDTIAELRATGYHQDAALAHVVERLMADGREDHSSQVFLLSSPNDPMTLRIDGRIEHVERRLSGQRTAWTQGNRYADERALRSNPRTTADLASPLSSDSE